MEKIENSEVSSAFEALPADMRKKLLRLRKLVFDAARESSEIGVVEETLKWGEPGYLAKKGSTVRLAVHSKVADRYGVYFNCQTSLVETFRELYSDQLKFDGKRAIVFDRGDKIPDQIVKHCIAMSLNYHRIKHLPMLGA